jgi:hypothetical protein
MFATRRAFSLQNFLICFRSLLHINIIKMNRIIPQYSELPTYMRALRQGNATGMQILKFLKCKFVHTFS